MNKTMEFVKRCAAEADGTGVLLDGERYCLWGRIYCRLGVPREVLRIGQEALRVPVASRFWFPITGAEEWDDGDGEEAQRLAVKAIEEYGGLKALQTDLRFWFGGPRE